MKHRFLSLLLVLSSLFFLNGARAQSDHLKEFPPLTLNGSVDESFKNSSTTKELYAKYYAFARMVKTGDFAAQKRIITINLEKDLAYWKAEASRSFTPPKAPNTKNKKVLADFETRRAKAEALDAKKKAAAQAYVSWLGEEIPAWLKKME
jgi:hypothetical protein